MQTALEFLAQKGVVGKLYVVSCMNPGQGRQLVLGVLEMFVSGLPVFHLGKDDKYLTVREGAELAIAEADSRAIADFINGSGRSFFPNVAGNWIPAPPDERFKSMPQTAAVAAQ